MYAITLSSNGRSASPVIKPFGTLVIIYCIAPEYVSNPAISYAKFVISSKPSLNGLIVNKTKFAIAPYYSKTAM